MYIIILFFLKTLSLDAFTFFARRKIVMHRGDLSYPIIIIFI